MTQIICLANSKKEGERCIAGIDLQTGAWIRPVCKDYPEDGRVPKRIRLIDGEEPTLLDVLDIPLENSGLDFGFESENLNIAQGQWKKVGQASPQDVLHFATRNSLILHNVNKYDRYVTVPYLKSLPFQKRTTLQLVHVDKLLIYKNPWKKWIGNLIIDNRSILENIKITDLILLNKLESGYQVTGSCLVTMSLSMPFPKESDRCWKLIAGVIEL